MNFSADDLIFGILFSLGIGLLVGSNGNWVAGLGAGLAVFPLFTVFVFNAYSSWCESRSKKVG